MLKLLSFAFLAILVVLFAAACSPEPIPLADVPVYPGATPIALGQNETVDELARVIERSSGSEGVTVEVKLYTLPQDTAWDALVSYYDGELAGSDWRLEQDLSNESDVFSTRGWGRGSGSNEQALVVGYVADPVVGDAFLILGLYTE
jgi:hypothetical protein